MVADVLKSAFGRPVCIAIVGHTNTGKTSLIRTLTRDTGFGVVSPRASTTKHVEKVRLIADGRPLVELYDTPGMEEPIALRDFLKQLEMAATDRPDGPTLIGRFLDTDSSKTEFEQEAKVVRQLLASDAGLYVIDTRDPVLEKYQQELDLLSDCGKPLVAVLNFVAMDTARVNDWRDMLKRVGLHFHVRFDAVAPERDAEKILYGGLQHQLPEFGENFEKLVECRGRDAAERHRTAMYAVADMLLDLSAVAAEYPMKQKQPPPELVENLAHKVRARERQTIARLLEIYQFGPDDLFEENIPLKEGYWAQDPFDRAHLKYFSREMATGVIAGAGAGAATGAVIDATVGGVTLGLGMAVGAALGGGTAFYNGHYEQGRALIKRKKRVIIDGMVLLVILRRTLALINRLEKRGHGAVTPLKPLEDTSAGGNPEVKVYGGINDARRHPSWSRLNQGEVNEVSREKALRRLIKDLSD